MEKAKRKDGYRYREKIQINGKIIKSPWFKRITDARTWKTAQLKERDKLKAMGMDYIPDKKLNEFSKQFIINKRDLARRTIDSYRSALDLYILPNFGHLNLKQIKIHHGNELKDFLLSKGLSSRRVNNVLKVFKMLMNEAVCLELLLKSPLINLRFVKVKPKEASYWTQHEAYTFLKAIREDHYFYLYLVTLNTGLRKGEVLGLQWDCVDFINKKLTIKRTKDRYGLKETTKSNKIRFVPLNDIALEALKSVRERSKCMSYVFTKPNGEPIDYGHFTYRVFNNAIKKAGVKKIKFHDLRSSFASAYCASGGSIFTLSKILGHSSVQITEDSYAHFHPNHMEGLTDIVNFSCEKEPKTALRISG